MHLFAKVGKPGQDVPLVSNAEFNPPKKKVKKKLT